MKRIGIILAAGSGLRMGEKTPKCLIKINGKEIYKYSLDIFQKSKLFDSIILVLPQKHEFSSKNFAKNVILVKGGKTRNESFEKAMNIVREIANLNDQIIIHDAARIFVTINDLKHLANSKQKFATLCFESTDTMYGSKSLKLLPKPNYNIQTPQMCTYATYLKAKKNFEGTDLFSYLNLKPTNKSFIISDNKLFNIKITYLRDIEIVKLFLKNK